ncbi:hypothetical protein SPRG_07511 [Saprolegnia parasitica CBS 223.65]|uniref:TOG domain-containing protein n=1 Tax=Saprolegnia parasitica (strain CBS 223.65) TaxID=695850 RepID=A0A067CKF4_SAPPC|nr:hypothetical protein SPRG_07511 [Saprolegnia parasitica CBS 223.65]KDO27262.1 hypothetical protein SPRG_07511 [Saprolegnia parasitica CBS 223.65]|eukprot:XP_012202039.1 hypothetical protein SPRG_07511 [Saprolegnia parasitica CBS 223.65]
MPVGTEAKKGVMGRLKSKISSSLGRKQPKDAANALTNQGSALSLAADDEDDDDDGDIEHHDSEIDSKGDEDHLTSSTEDATSNNEPPADVLADLVIVGKAPIEPSLVAQPQQDASVPRPFADDAPPSPIKQAPASPMKRAPTSPAKRPIGSPMKRSTAAPTSPLSRPLASPAKRAMGSPAKRTSIPGGDSPNIDVAPVVKAKKTRAPSFHENAPILASASMGEAPPPEKSGPTLAAETSSSLEAPPFDAGAAITSTFGERVARLLGADPWGDRQDGFDAIGIFVKKLDAAAPASTLSAALAAINCGIVDRVAPVMYCALECLTHVLAAFAPLVSAKPKRFASVHPQLQTLLQSLLVKLNDSNKRTQREALHGILRLLKAPKLPALSLLMATFEAEPLDRPRLELIHDMVVDLGFSDALTTERVLGWTIPALKIVDEKTRKLALDIAATAIVRSPDSKATLEGLVGVKPAMLKVLSRRVDEIKAEGPSNNHAAAEVPSAPTIGNNASNNNNQQAEPEPVLIEVPREDDAAVLAMVAAAMGTAETVVGPVAWRKLESKTWSDRKEALSDIEKAVDESKSDLRDVKPTAGSPTQGHFVGYAAVVHHCLYDSIAPVINGAIDLFSTLIKIYGPHIDWRDTLVKDLTLQCIGRLLRGMQKPNNRTSKGSCRCLLKLARLNVHTMQGAIACVFHKETDALVQMHVLRLLVPEFGLTTDADAGALQLHASLVLGAVAKALAHSNEKVRRAAMDVALCSQRLIGKSRVLQRLGDVKPATLKELEKNFVDVEISDGRPATVNSPPTPAESLGLGGPEMTASRRTLSSAPVAGGKADDDARAMEWTPRPVPSVLSNEEESLMDDILGL